MIHLYEICVYTMLWAIREHGGQVECRQRAWWLEANRSPPSAWLDALRSGVAVLSLSLWSKDLWPSRGERGGEAAIRIRGGRGRFRRRGYLICVWGFLGLMWIWVWCFWCLDFFYSCIVPGLLVVDFCLICCSGFLFQLFWSCFGDVFVCDGIFF